MERKKDRDFRLDPGQIEVMDDRMAEVYKKKSPMERIKIASDMWESAWRQIQAVVRALHPDWSEDAVRGEVIRRLSHDMK